ncbi:hypothetical protein WICMUC_001682 [Wickerhamomyces mucosus]|uniref:Uncharacterized protein n=1 Tax=Wickerhamomyces mucosus TaxID=1378264 RepID=A0A9P8PTH0_9ASCO|nr:hypothetical protein WICMUC_001682 [Wickerhamomyces mucosus]
MLNGVNNRRTLVTNLLSDRIMLDFQNFLRYTNDNYFYKSIDNFNFRNYNGQINQRNELDVYMGYTEVDAIGGSQRSRLMATPQRVEWMFKKMVSGVLETKDFTSMYLITVKLLEKKVCIYLGSFSSLEKSKTSFQNYVKDQLNLQWSSINFVQTIEKMSSINFLAFNKNLFREYTLWYILEDIIIKNRELKTRFKVINQFFFPQTFDFTCLRSKDLHFCFLKNSKAIGFHQSRIQFF